MKHLFTTLLGLLVATTCMAWGQKGHDTTCAIAQERLAPSVQQRISFILDGKSIVYWSNWFDNAVHQPEYAYGKTWHYKNIDADEEYDAVPDFPEGDVVSELQHLYDKLKALEAERPWAEAARDSLKAEEALALKMFVHLMGDLHQPMHMGHASDLGGNKVNVKFFGRDANLHSVWDTNIVESAHAWSHTEWRDELRTRDHKLLSEIMKGDFKSWGRETYELCKKVYADTPEGTCISYDYVAKWAPIIEMQFVRGGTRLAMLLNDIYGAGSSHQGHHTHQAGMPGRAKVHAVQQHRRGYHGKAPQHRKQSKK